MATVGVNADRLPDEMNEMKIKDDKVNDVTSYYVVGLCGFLGSCLKIGITLSYTL